MQKYVGFAKKDLRKKIKKSEIIVILQENLVGRLIINVISNLKKQRLLQ